MPLDVEALRSRLAQASSLPARGRVTAVAGLSVRFRLPGVRIADMVEVKRRGEPLACEVVAFEGGEAIAMPLGTLAGVGPDDEVESTGAPLRVRAGRGLLGRVVDGLGRPFDGGTALAGEWVPVDRDPPGALERRPVERPLPTGVRVLDGLVTLGEGQRVGLFSGSGVGKSTLLAAIAAGAGADVVVVALVGERGREVGEFLEHALDDDARRRSVVVVATSDAAPLERLRAPQVATAYAEHFRDQGARVLLLVDSVTRFARASREVGLAAGEPPTRRGYPPSTFAALPRLLERSGQGARGSITAVYTVLVEGGDLEEPVADEVRGILDGHVVLDRAVATRGRYPAVDVCASLSRVMHRVVTPGHAAAAKRLRALVATFESKRDLVALGGYAKGTDTELDEAIALMPGIDAFLAQGASERSTMDETIAALASAVRSDTQSGSRREKPC
jgi:type III secretion protein N (ATPase)